MSKCVVRLEILVRILTDLIVLNACLLISLLPELLFRHLPARVLIGLWWPDACVLSMLGPTVFYLMGFYTKGRSYSGKYKALIIVQAVALVFCMLGFGLYFLQLQPSFPRSALLISWAGSTALLIVARLWAKLGDRLLSRKLRMMRF